MGGGRGISKNGGEDVDTLGKVCDYNIYYSRFSVPQLSNERDESIIIIIIILL